VKRLLDSYRMTPLGGALVLILLAAALVLLIGPRHDEAPAFIVIVVVLGIVVTNVIGPNYRPGRGGKTLEQRREEFHPQRRRLGETPETDVDTQAWAPERERER
jgi:hypothetical protein